MALITGYPIWSYILWGLGIVWFIITIIYGSIGKRKSFKYKESTNWITAYQLDTRKLPPVTEYFLPLVQRYIQGDPITKDIELIPMGGQFWNNLTSQPKRRVKAINSVARDELG